MLLGLSYHRSLAYELFSSCINTYNLQGIDGINIFPPYYMFSNSQYCKSSLILCLVLFILLLPTVYFSMHHHIFHKIALQILCDPIFWRSKILDAVLFCFRPFVWYHPLPSVHERRRRCVMENASGGVPSCRPCSFFASHKSLEVSSRLFFVLWKVSFMISLALFESLHLRAIS